MTKIIIRLNPPSVRIDTAADQNEPRHASGTSSNVEESTSELPSYEALPLTDLFFPEGEIFQPVIPRPQREGEATDFFPNRTFSPIPPPAAAIDANEVMRELASTYQSTLFQPLPNPLCSEASVSPSIYFFQSHSLNRWSRKETCPPREETSQSEFNFAKWLQIEGRKLPTPKKVQAYEAMITDAINNGQFTDQIIAALQNNEKGLTDQAASERINNLIRVDSALAQMLEANNAQYERARQRTPEEVPAYAVRIKNAINKGQSTDQIITALQANEEGLTDEAADERIRKRIETNSALARKLRANDAQYERATRRLSEEVLAHAAWIEDAINKEQSTVQIINGLRNKGLTGEAAYRQIRNWVATDSVLAKKLKDNDAVNARARRRTGEVAVYAAGVTNTVDNGQFTIQIITDLQNNEESLTRKATVGRIRNRLKMDSVPAKKLKAYGAKNEGARRRTPEEVLARAAETTNTTGNAQPTIQITTDLQNNEKSLADRAAYGQVRQGLEINSALDKNLRANDAQYERARQRTPEEAPAHAAWIEDAINDGQPTDQIITGLRKQGLKGEDAYKQIRNRVATDPALAKKLKANGRLRRLPFSRRRKL